ncbi:hypothetical protein Cpap_0450 [Ruminiclostridium papyrosolvens DSM 2782]|uniref:Uncharacterized protein n=1 Tax=Ruminiclostridium papyrosolvens DSM 2782 TaxID=588581 RepID=F1THF3_9FIRM|nr:hypothetical protein Cpap_0450 [Ruminiclostridium papyrosolvens DSM 2782]
MKAGGICMLENGSEVCSCKKIKCIRHGRCQECIAYHNGKNSLPRCKRKEANIWVWLFRR